MKPTKAALWSDCVSLWQLLTGHTHEPRSISTKAGAVSSRSSMKALKAASEQLIEDIRSEGGFVL